MNEKFIVTLQRTKKGTIYELTWFYFKRQLLSILMSIRPSRPPFKGGCCNKNTPSMRATKINKNQGDILLFGQKNIALLY